MTPACWGWQLQYKMVCPGPPLLLKALLNTLNTHYNRKQRLGEAELNREMGSTLGSLIPKSACLSCKLQPLKKISSRQEQPWVSWAEATSWAGMSLPLAYFPTFSINTWLPMALRTFFYITNLRPISWQFLWSTSRLTVTQSLWLEATISHSGQELGNALHENSLNSLVFILMVRTSLSSCTVKIPIMEHLFFLIVLILG